MMYGLLALLLVTTARGAWIRVTPGMVQDTLTEGVEYQYATDRHGGLRI